MSASLPERAAAVFGSSEPRPEDAAYQQARLAGHMLAEAGWTVVTGGYGGVMEAASRGAREAGGEALGVTVAAFARRTGANAYLSREIREPDLYQRTRTLVDAARGYLIMPGQAGTLAELAFLWALRRAELLGDKPIVLCGAHWPALLDSLRSAGILNPATLRATWQAAATEAAVHLLLEKLT